MPPRLYDDGGSVSPVHASLLHRTLAGPALSERESAVLGHRGSSNSVEPGRHRTYSGPLCAKGPSTQTPRLCAFPSRPPADQSSTPLNGTKCSLDGEITRMPRRPSRIRLARPPRRLGTVPCSAAGAAMRAPSGVRSHEFLSDSGHPRVAPRPVIRALGLLKTGNVYTGDCICSSGPNCSKELRRARD